MALGGAMRRPFTGSSTHRARNCEKEEAPVARRPWTVSTPQGIAQPYKKLGKEVLRPLTQGSTPSQRGNADNLANGNSCGSTSSPRKLHSAPGACFSEVQPLRHSALRKPSQGQTHPKRLFSAPAAAGVGVAEARQQAFDSIFGSAEQKGYPAPPWQELRDIRLRDMLAAAWPAALDARSPIPSTFKLYSTKPTTSRNRSQRSMQDVQSSREDTNTMSAWLPAFSKSTEEQIAQDLQSAWGGGSWATVDPGPESVPEQQYATSLYAQETNRVCLPPLGLAENQYVHDTIDEHPFSLDTPALAIELLEYVACDLQQQPGSKAAANAEGVESTDMTRSLAPGVTTSNPQLPASGAVGSTGIDASRAVQHRSTQEFSDYKAWCEKNKPAPAQLEATLNSRLAKGDTVNEDADINAEDLSQVSLAQSIVRRGTITQPAPDSEDFDPFSMVATPDPEPEHDSKPDATMATGTQHGNRPDCPHYMSQKNGGLSGMRRSAHHITWHAESQHPEAARRRASRSGTRSSLQRASTLGIGSQAALASPAHSAAVARSQTANLEGSETKRSEASNEESPRQLLHNALANNHLHKDTSSLLQELFETKKASLIEQDQSKREAYSGMTFEKLVNLHSNYKKYNVDLWDVIFRWEEFVELDVSNTGHLSLAEFKTAIRNRFKLPDGPVPSHLLDKHWTSFEGEVDFGQYLTWTVQHAFTEEVLVPDKLQRRIRQIARDQGLFLNDVERIQKVYDFFDTDQSGNIDREEFSKVMHTLLKVNDESHMSERMIDRYWHEVDKDFSGSVEFEEFLQWYIQYFSHLI